MTVTVSGYSFSPDDLAVDTRTPGISAFMRIRNGAEFLERTIRSHIDALDEIVAVHNQSEDGTLQILEDLAREYAPRLRVFHYVDPVHAPGSDGHKFEPARSPNSFVNMSNFALSRTRHTVAMKLDDDHLAMAGRVEALTARIRSQRYRLPQTLCFGGINVIAMDDGRFAVPGNEPLVGAGDHYFVEITPNTHFIHDKRYETFAHRAPRRMADITYWHLKYLKAGMGFANVMADGTSNERFRRKRERFLQGDEFLSIEQLMARRPPMLSLLSALPLPEKTRLKADRWRLLLDNPPSLEELSRQLATAR